MHYKLIFKLNIHLTCLAHESSLIYFCGASSIIVQKIYDKMKIRHALLTIVNYNTGKC